MIIIVANSSVTADLGVPPNATAVPTTWCSTRSPFAPRSEVCEGQSLSFVDWISDTRSQVYTDLQSLVKCRDPRSIVLVLDTVCSQARFVLGCAMH